MENILNYSDDEEADNFQQNKAAALMDLDNNPKFKLIVEQLEDHMKKFQDPKKYMEFCHICQHPLHSFMHAKTHYVCAKHQEKFESLLEKTIGNLKSSAIKLPPMYWDTEIPREFMAPTLKPKQPAVKCVLCNLDIKPTDKTHIKEFPHQGMQFLLNQLPPELLLTTVQVQKKQIVCLLCDSGLPSLSVVKTHANSKRHQKMVEERMDMERVFEEQRSLQVEVDPAIKWPFCHLCQIHFTDKQSMNKHTLTFPHNSLSKMKSEAIKGDVPHDQYWQVENISITCNICDVALFTEKEATKHLNGSRHKNFFSEWCLEVSSVEGTNSEFFFCKICAVDLDGTSEALGHYESEKHLRMLVGKQESNKPIQEFIYLELNKLVETIYFSKKIPPEVGVDYMKLFNRYLIESCQ